MASTTATPAGTAGSERQGDLRNYILVTGAYWTDTLVDGAIRTLVLFYFNQLGYTPLQVASLFIFYETAGIVTNLVGGWLAARLGLKITLFMGLTIQITALCMLGFAPPSLLVVPYVMASQALSGVAKDLDKMSSKSAVKLVVREGDESSLYRWVAVLTGSKNALKGVGFFLGGLLLTLFGFQTATLVLAVLILTALITTATLIRGHLGRPDKTAKFKHMFSNNRAVNILAAARIFLFAARDVWFVVGLPFFLIDELHWSFWAVGTLLAVWVIGYGGMQAAAPRLVRGRGLGSHGEPDGRTAVWLAFGVALCPAAMALMLGAGVNPTVAILAGLVPFGITFAMNSAVHSFLILAYADSDKVAMKVGFYYMANAMGRLAGTILSGLLYQWHGLTACLWTSSAFLIIAGLLSLLLPSGVAGRAQQTELARAAPLRLMSPPLTRRLFAEFLGSAFLPALVIGSGIAAQTLSPNDVGLELFENAAATAAGLFTIILMFGPVSGGHFNPVVSLVDASFGGISWRDARAYIPAQVAGCILGAIVANGMFSLAAVSISTHHRASPAHLFSEVIATAGLILVIFSLARSKRANTIPAAVGAYIGAAYFFTSSASFANPAITVGRMFSNTFAGIAPASVPGYVVAQLVGGACAILVIRALYPDVTPEEAADVLLPHGETRPDVVGAEHGATAPLPR